MKSDQDIRKTRYGRRRFFRVHPLGILYKITGRSVIYYALPVYFKGLKQTEIVRLEQIQYRAAKLVTGALHLVSREKINTELGWETIQKR